MKIVSGGQTGADRSALDWALAHGIACGGWCPKGRRAEDGALNQRYPLSETPAADYIQRTEWNVRDSDGTVIFSLGKELAGGSRKTVDFAREQNKPFLHLHPGCSGPVKALRTFIAENGIVILNVAGPRASEEPEVGKFVQSVLAGALPTT